MATRIHKQTKKGLARTQRALEPIRDALAILEPPVLPVSSNGEVPIWATKLMTEASKMMVYGQAADQFKEAFLLFTASVTGIFAIIYSKLEVEPSLLVERGDCQIISEYFAQRHDPETNKITLLINELLFGIIMKISSYQGIIERKNFKRIIHDLREPAKEEINIIMGLLDKTPDNFSAVSVGYDPGLPGRQPLGCRRASSIYGAGQVEAWLMKELGITITCVDPYPDGYEISRDDPDKVYPHYPYTADYVRDHPDPVDCLILWYTSPSASNYDYEAIQLLRPRSVIVMYEQTGTAGGEALHKFIWHARPDHEKELKDGQYYDLDELEEIKQIPVNVKPSDYVARWVPGEVYKSLSGLDQFRFGLEVLIKKP